MLLQRSRLMCHSRWGSGVWAAPTPRHRSRAVSGGPVALAGHACAMWRFCLVSLAPMAPPPSACITLQIDHEATAERKRWGGGGRSHSRTHCGDQDTYARNPARRRAPQAALGAHPPAWPAHTPGPRGCCCWCCVLLWSLGVCFWQQAQWMPRRHRDQVSR